jgi:selenocysteine lyase/cysteine desulfurase
MIGIRYQAGSPTGCGGFVQGQEEPSLQTALPSQQYSVASRHCHNHGQDLKPIWPDAVREGDIEAFCFCSRLQEPESWYCLLAVSRPVITPPGSFGAFPAAIRKKADELRDQWDARPCPFTKYEYPKLLDESRDALAEFLNVPVSTVVFVPNATTGVNTVLRNISWNPDGKDEILQLNIIYNACAKTTNYICEVTNDLVRTRDINLTFPIEDADLLSAIKAAI